MARSKAKSAAATEQHARQPEPSQQQNETQEPDQTNNLKNDIRKKVRMDMVIKNSIDKEEIISGYVKDYPEKADWIRDIVLG